MNVGEVCSRDVYIVRPAEPLREAVALMHRHQVGAVIAVRQERDLVRPIGIVTDRDVVFAQIFSERGLAGLRVEDAMTAAPTTIAETSGLSEAIRRMSESGVRRAVVVGDSGDLVGILSLDDLLPVVSDALADLAGLIGAQARAADGGRGARVP